MLKEFLIFLTILCWYSIWTKDNNEDECINCHKIISPKIVKEYSESVHSQVDFACINCHYGDNREKDEKKAHNVKEFKGKFLKKEIINMCNRCHGDLNTMKPYRLNTNIYNEYLASQHGKLLIEKDDTKVPVCIDCHGVHRILSRKNSLSPTYKLNIPSTCARCHSDREYMKEYNIPTNQFDEYSQGIHGKILFGQMKNKNSFLVPTCVDCHGVHSATPPEVTKVHYICGTCHFDVFQYFKSGIHYDALKTKDSPKCIDCHSNHLNTLPQEGLLLSNAKGSCSSCHTPEEKDVLELAIAIQKIILDSRHSIEILKQIKNDAFVQNYKEIIDIVDINLNKSEEHFSQLLKLSHALDISLLQEIYKSITTLVNSTVVFKDKFIAKEKQLPHRFLIFLVLLFIIILLLISLTISLFVVKKIKKKISL